MTSNPAVQVTCVCDRFTGVNRTTDSCARIGSGESCRSPKLRKTLNPVFVTMLQAAPEAIHFKRILNFGEGHCVRQTLTAFIIWATTYMNGVADWYDASYYSCSPERNPRGPSNANRRASRGGSWRHHIKVSRTAVRSSIPPAFKYADYGFRVARSSITCIRFTHHHERWRECCKGDRAPGST